jgi:uncharacterized membrane protein
MTYAETRKFISDAIMLMKQLEEVLKSEPSTVTELTDILKNETKMKELLSEEWVRLAKKTLQSGMFKTQYRQQRVCSVVQKLLVIFGMKIYCNGVTKTFRTCPDIMVAIDKKNIVICE